MLLDYEAGTTPADMTLAASVHVWAERTGRDMAESPLATLLTEREVVDVCRIMDAIKHAHTDPTFKTIRKALWRVDNLLVLRKRAIDRVLAAGETC